MAGIFKAYDIRGIYGDTLDNETAFKIGRAYATFLACRTVAVGRDMRPHSQPIFEHLTRGLTLQGVEVTDLGLCSTPMSNFANGELGLDGSIMITASHNPAEWNGFKLSRAQALPISGDTGIADIERIVAEEDFAPPAPQAGKIVAFDVVDAYAKRVATVADLRRPVRIAADMANAMGCLEARALREFVELDALYDTLDGTFPHHEANPMKTETLAALQDKIRHGRYDFGIAFDGDADRVGFLDETGAIVPMDLSGALIAQDVLAQEKGVILHDLRSSWAFREAIAEAGGAAVMSRVGHSFIKQQMRDHNALFAGELSGHYYFRDNFYTESSAMAVLRMANIVSRSDRPLSEWIRPLRRYAASGEINSTVTDPPGVLARLKEQYADGNILELDGVTVEYDDWWFNVRVSNTEPLVRLNLEARAEERMREKRDEILAAIRR
jgi:phosphomannomutase